MSTIKPSNLPSWATTAGTRLEPTSGQKAAGFSAGDKPPARWHNYLWGTLCDWAAYVNGLATDDSFLGANYTWTGQQKFTTLPQRATPLARSTGLPVQDAKEIGHNTPTYSADGSPTWDSSNTQTYRLAFKIPNGATLTGVSVVMQGGGTITGTLKLFKRTGAAGGSAATQLGGTQSATAGTVSLGITSLAEVATDLSWYFIETTSDNVATWERASVQWTDSTIQSSAR